MTFVFAIAFFLILGALAAAGYFMLRSSGQEAGSDTEQAAKNSRMARALTIRIGVSVLLFICVLIAWKFGYIKPSGLPVGR